MFRFSVSIPKRASAGKGHWMHQCRVQGKDWVWCVTGMISPCKSGLLIKVFLPLFLRSADTGSSLTIVLICHQMNSFLGGQGAAWNWDDSKPCWAQETKQKQEATFEVRVKTWKIITLTTALGYTGYVADIKVKWKGTH